MSLIIDCLATSSVIGIWPRFIEPRLLKTTRLTWHLPATGFHLDRLKIIHLSDLHFHHKTPPSFTEKIVRYVDRLKPDLIVFTGDFLCYSHLECPDRLATFLCQLQAPLGSFCIFGNHDYAHYVTLNAEGNYDLSFPINPLQGILRGLKTICSGPYRKHNVSDRLFTVPFHEKLCKLLEQTPFKLLENTSVTLPIGLNLTGLGDLALGRCQPEKAFVNYNPRFPGIVLSHNPDSFPLLQTYPGDWILSGHTHGEQIHVPWPRWGRRLSQKLAKLETAYTRGLFAIGNKYLYVNRGLGCHKPFRLFSPPEICLIQATVESA
jgi:predicted MPP superfamily phosphohydrolase